MDHVVCKYAGRTYPAVGAPVAFNLERKEGGQFLVVLASHADAEHLRDDLDQMLRASRAPKSN